MTWFCTALSNLNHMSLLCCVWVKRLQTTHCYLSMAPCNLVVIIRQKGCEFKPIANCKMFLNTLINLTCVDRKLSELWAQESPWDWDSYFSGNMAARGSSPALSRKIFRMGSSSSSSIVYRKLNILHCIFQQLRC